MFRVVESAIIKKHHGYNSKKLIGKLTIDFSLADMKITVKRTSSFSAYFLQNKSAMLNVLAAQANFLKSSLSGHLRNCSFWHISSPVIFHS